MNFNLIPIPPRLLTDKQSQEPWTLESFIVLLIIITLIVGIILCIEFWDKFSWLKRNRK